MRLHEESSGAGFYESFSDIIFATMAIFVLLMTIFLVLAHESSPARKAQKKLQEIKEQISETALETEKIDSQSEELASKLKKLANRNVEISIAVDKSASMEQELYNLKHAINGLAKILPKVMDSVRISVTAYRMTQNDRDVTEHFPMTRILDSKEDGSASLKRLTDFLARQTHEGGSAPVLSATQKALSQFNQSASERDHQVFMLLGDVGPYEITYATPDVITGEGRRRAEQLLREVKTWAGSKKNRNMIILFSGRDEINDRSYPSSRRYKHQTSMELFKMIAKESGQPESYAENQSQMLVDFLVAALKRK